MPRSVLRIGTRGSALALAQAEWVRIAVSALLPKRTFELVPMKTRGDTYQGPLPPVGGKGLFARDIQDALASGQVDLTVHSAKDLPVVAPEGIVLGAIPAREDPRDALVTRTGWGLAKLAPGTTVGTSSSRRGMQLLALGRGLVPAPIRGNVDTRLRKLSAGEVQALVVAMAGLKRLGKHERVAELLSADVMLPAPGQGALAVECRANDKDMRPTLARFEDPAARRAFDAERAFLVALGGDCDVPLAALAITIGDGVRLRGMVGTPDGQRIVADQVDEEDPEKAGLELAERLRDRGAEEILAAVRGTAPAVPDPPPAPPE
ncbi:MAG: hydroxymethylbilane synthase [Acidobacteria bacterium]|nr:hydroxymethylbilane synthase [Acidobacteriota bacterium]